MVKELKSNNSFSKALASQIQRIKLQGKTREQDYIQKSDAKQKSYSNLNKQIKERYNQTGNVNTRPSGEKAMQRLDRLQRNERIKQKVYVAASRVETGVSTVLENVTSKIGRAMNQRVISRGIVKKNRPTIVVKEDRQAEYVPIYFQAELNNVKKQMFFD
jgi:ABC-type molybdate transport system substrate-binding protein